MEEGGNGSNAKDGRDGKEGTRVEAQGRGGKRGGDLAAKGRKRHKEEEGRSVVDRMNGVYGMEEGGGGSNAKDGRYGKEGTRAETLRRGEKRDLAAKGLKKHKEEGRREERCGQDERDLQDGRRRGWE